MAAPKEGKPVRGDLDYDYDADAAETPVGPYVMDDGIIDKVPVYRVTPILSVHSQDVMASVQEWWDALPAAAYGPVSEHITWKMDGCTFDLKIRSNDDV